MRPIPVAFAVVLLPAAAVAAPRSYRVDAAASLVQVHVGKSGAFSFAGHKHEVVAPALEGTVVADPDDLAASSVSVTFTAASLRVTGEGEPAKDVPKVQAAMVGPEVLDATRFPAVTFRSRQVSGQAAPGGGWTLTVVGDFTLHGVTRSLSLPLRVAVEGDVLTATGRTVIGQKDFGIQPVSAAGGTVKVKNELAIEYRIVARASE
jgi:polyisoprenoid-binding protein YceI